MPLQSTKRLGTLILGSPISVLYRLLLHITIMNDSLKPSTKRLENVKYHRIRATASTGVSISLPSAIMNEFIQWIRSNI